jgi:hypothetical protein
MVIALKTSMHQSYGRRRGCGCISHGVARKGDLPQIKGKGRDGFLKKVDG